MPLDIELIDKFLKQRGLKKNEIATEIGMTREGFTRSLVTNKLHADKLEKLANILKLNVCDLFGVTKDERSTVPITEVCEKCALKDELIKTQSGEVSALRKIISLLEEQYSLSLKH